MTERIQHLPGIGISQLKTSRLQTQLLTCGQPDGPPVLFLHGNLSAATIWEETLVGLPPRYHGCAVDLRGYGGSDPTAIIDATRGFADWADDVVALADELRWDRFHVVGHSLGGCVVWALIGAISQRLASVTLVSPGPPCGFGGAHGDRGELNHSDGAGSGGGLVHPGLVERLAAGEREISDEFFSPRAAMLRLCFKPPFRPSREEDLLTAMLQIHRGDQEFPGDWQASPHWPGFAPGRLGPINAISPRHNQWVLPTLLKASHKPPLLWVYGEQDVIISDNSFSDAGVQGKLGIRSDWPGDEVFPPQPYLSQVKWTLDQYELAGGKVKRLILPGVGHTPYLESPAQFQAALTELLIECDEC